MFIYAVPGGQSIFREKNLYIPQIKNEKRRFLFTIQLVFVLFTYIPSSACKPPHLEASPYHSIRVFIKKLQNKNRKKELEDVWMLEYIKRESKKKVDWHCRSKLSLKMYK